MPSTPQLYLYLPSFGIGFGVPFRIENKIVYSGFRLRTDISWGLFTLNINWDFIPDLYNTSQNKSYYGLTF